MEDAKLFPAFPELSVLANSAELPELLPEKELTRFIAWQERLA